MAPETPRRFTPESAMAEVMRKPRPGVSLPSTFNVASFSAGARPSALAAFRTLPPLTGVRKATPLPALEGSRRAMTHSRLAPAPESAPKSFARPPGLSSIWAAQTSIFVTVRLIKHRLLWASILNGPISETSEFDERGCACEADSVGPDLRAGRTGDDHRSRCEERDFDRRVREGRVRARRISPGCCSDGCASSASAYPDDVVCFHSRLRPALDGFWFRGRSQADSGYDGHWGHVCGLCYRGFLNSGEFLSGGKVLR